MGIKHLNKFLKKECNESIELVHLKSLSGKTIVIDTSIYLYKFLTDGEESLIENLLTMLNLFRYYKITPLFIFDGEIPAEKKALLEKRKEEKKTAERAYYILKESMNENVETQQQMIELKKRFVYIKREQIELVKRLFDAYGVNYVVAKGEADEMCAYLVLKGTAWACLSEDMDMFVYGVPRILRYLSMINHNVVLYDLPKILTQLKINQNELREICVLSGTDYDMENSMNSYHLYQVLDLFKKYRSGSENQEKEKPSFYEWLVKNTNSINDSMIEKLLQIKKRFEICGSGYLMDCKKNKMMIKDKLEFLLRNNGGFLF
jgi:5'-3' exonuclease